MKREFVWIERHSRRHVCACKRPHRSPETALKCPAVRRPTYLQVDGHQKVVVMDLLAYTDSVQPLTKQEHRRYLRRLTAIRRNSVSHGVSA